MSRPRLRVETHISVMLVTRSDVYWPQRNVQLRESISPAPSSVTNIVFPKHNNKKTMTSPTYIHPPNCEVVTNKIHTHEYFMAFHPGQNRNRCYLPSIFFSIIICLFLDTCTTMNRFQLSLQQRPMRYFSSPLLSSFCSYLAVVKRQEFLTVYARSNLQAMQRMLPDMTSLNV